MCAAALRLLPLFLPRSVTTVETAWLDGKHVVFGEVKSGQDLVRAIEKLGSGSGKTSAEIKIVSCGQLA